MEITKKQFLYRVKKKDGILLKKLKEGSVRQKISWDTPIVGIHLYLLDEKPCDLMRTAMGMRKIPLGRYRKILERWRKNKLGGVKKNIISAGRCAWEPSKRAMLFFLASNEQAVYYLIIKSDKIKFLKRTSDELLIVRNDIYLDGIISYVLGELGI
jgi:hypothetical protein